MHKKIKNYAPIIGAVITTVGAIIAAIITVTANTDSGDKTTINIQGNDNNNININSPQTINKTENSAYLQMDGYITYIPGFKGSYPIYSSIPNQRIRECNITFDKALPDGVNVNLTKACDKIEVDFPFIPKLSTNKDEKINYKIIAKDANDTFFPIHSASFNIDNTISVRVDPDNLTYKIDKNSKLHNIKVHSGDISVGYSTELPEFYHCEWQDGEDNLLSGSNIFMAIPSSKNNCAIDLGLAITLSDIRTWKAASGKNFFNAINTYGYRYVSLMNKLKEKKGDKLQLSLTVYDRLGTEIALAYLQIRIKP